MTPSKIGVTGGAGFIGSHLCERLLAEGREVVAVDDLSHGTTANMASFMQNPGFRFHQMDCRNARELRRVFAGCDAVAHLAAEKIPRYGGALQTLESNVQGAHAACEVALSLDAPVIVTSTSDVYGNATPPFNEEDHVVIGPSTTRRWAYAVSKLYDEHIALAMAEEKGLRPAILRLFNVYGPRNHPTWWGGPVTAFAEALLDGEIMELHGDGRQVRTFTYVTDTVDGFVRALDTQDAVGEIINIGADEPITMIRLATAIQEALEIPGPLRAKLVPYEKIGGRYQDVRCRIPDTEKAARILGFDARVGLSDGLAESVAWHVERRRLMDAGSAGGSVSAA
ncbi:MAG: NAD-dependent epimerase/dehydratase family protein [Thermoleophilaceae bacterium]|nr:NAD-dependent epimerase/dehydratase family protein [Thermoleophilaceae bacterium]